jgi:hypothetical protein
MKEVFKRHDAWTCRCGHKTLWRYNRCGLCRRLRHDRTGESTIVERVREETKELFKP